MDNPVAQVMVQPRHGDLDRIGNSPVAAMMFIVAAGLVFFADARLLEGKEKASHRGAQKRRQGEPGARLEVLQLLDKDPPQALLMETPMSILVVIKEQIEEGTYESEKKVDQLLDELVEDL